MTSAQRYPLGSKGVLVMPAIDRMMSGGLLFGGAVGCAEVGPVHIGAEILAADSTVRGLFDFRAILGRNARLAPCLDGLIGFHAQRFLGGFQATHELDGLVEMFGSLIHGATVPQENLAVQSNLAVTQDFFTYTIRA